MSDTKTCDKCGEAFDPDHRKAYVKRRRDGSEKAFCPDCMRSAGRKADAHADP